MGRDLKYTDDAMQISCRQQVQVASSTQQKEGSLKGATSFRKIHAAQQRLEAWLGAESIESLGYF